MDRLIGMPRALHHLDLWVDDGAVVVSHHQDDTLDRALTDTHLPHVFVGRPLEGDRAVRYVDLDNTTTFLQFGVTDSVPYYWLALTLVFLILFLDWRMQNSRVGRAC